MQCVNSKPSFVRVDVVNPRGVEGKREPHSV